MSSASSRESRQRLILDHVLREGTATVQSLVDLTGRSAMTIHRDLDDLVSQHLVRKFHGGVSALPTSVFESSSVFRMRRRVEQKAALARFAATFVDPGMSIMLDDSTTVLAMAAYLRERAPLTVVTNYRQVLDRLLDSDVTIIMIGGQYSRTHDSFISPPDQTNLETYAVDITFQSTSTMDSRTTYHQEQDVVSMKRSMLRAGARRVLLMDDSKVGHTSLHKYVPLDQFTDVVLTGDADAAVVAAAREVTTVHVEPA